jgi:hypothetical protein
LQLRRQRHMGRASWMEQLQYCKFILQKAMWMWLLHVSLVLQPACMCFSRAKARSGKRLCSLFLFSLSLSLFLPLSLSIFWIRINESTICAETTIHSYGAGELG